MNPADIVTKLKLLFEVVIILFGISESLRFGPVCALQADALLPPLAQ